MRRAAQWQGAFPAPQVVRTADGFAAIPFAPADVPIVRRYIEQHRSTDGPFDLVISYPLPLDDPAAAAEEVASYEDVGVTWIVRDWLPWETGPDEVRTQIRNRPASRATPPPRPPESLFRWLLLTDWWTDVASA
jgi:hypothetical protein